MSENPLEYAQARMRRFWNRIFMIGGVPVWFGKGDYSKGDRPLKIIPAALALQFAAALLLQFGGFCAFAIVQHGIKVYITYWTYEYIFQFLL